VVASKLAVPSMRPGTVAKTALLNRLRATRALPVATIVAPAGYGKTTLLAQWADRDARPFAWVSLDHRDEDPLVILRHVAAALDRIEPLDGRVLDALRDGAGSVWSSAVPRLGAALASLRQPAVVALDDAHVLRSPESLEIVRTLLTHVPDGSMLVLAARTAPDLPLAALRARGCLLELGAEGLALTPREARLLVRSTGVLTAPDDPHLSALVARCEGWPVALYLGARSLRADRADAEPFAGDDRHFADYVRSEYFERVRPRVRRFLRRTSVLNRMSGALCDAVLDDRGSGAELEKLERAHLLVQPLDDRRGWYRYHPLVRDLLRRELANHEPHVVPALNARAADWFEAHGDHEATIEHAAAAGDDARVAACLSALAFFAYGDGGAARLERRFADFDRDSVLERYPSVALHGSRVHAFRGRGAEAERWLAAAERRVLPARAARGNRSLHGRAAVLHAVLCRIGPAQMLADAERAADELQRDSEWLPLALLLRGVAHMLAGEDERAQTVLAQLLDHEEATRCAALRTLALGELAILAAARDDHGAAETFAHRAKTAANRLDGYGEAALAHAVAARALLRRGRWDEARSQLASVGTTVRLLTEAVPWLAVQTRIELARAWITLRDADAARAALAEAERVLALRPELGVLEGHLRDLKAELAGTTQSDRVNAGGLTPAELRVLPLLATHLSFREIGERLFVSRNTVKTQAISIYRKLGVSRRSDAIAAAARLGLGDLEPLVSVTKVDGQTSAATQRA
jgi:LuxR family transcriptional regulator, maltose regulon positive regulatory protein